MIKILWLRRDLRLHEHPALQAAVADADRLVPVFYFDDRLLHGRHASGPRTQFLLESLAALDASFRACGSRLVVRHGRPEDELVKLADEVGAAELHFTADVGPFAQRRDARVVAALSAVDVPAHSHPGLFVVDDLAGLRTSEGKPYTVFTPFWRAWREVPRREVHAAPRKLPPLPSGVNAGRLPSLETLELEQRVDDPPIGGEAAGRRRMGRFCSDAVDSYDEGRNALGRGGTSRLSPYLHLGCVSAREVEEHLGAGPGAAAVRRQLCWRDFYAHVLLHFPGNARSEHQARYRRGALRYCHARQQFDAWCAGRTGYPLVDAGMRQLEREGWMHNRARMVVASFLTKDLALDWRWGERWFMRLLLDGDEANNNGNWQWMASVGVDPQPPFKRIFNPARQQERFDPEGRYVRRYVPELRDVPAQYLAEPWKMPDEVQRQVGCVIGADYPAPIVDHLAARKQAIERYAIAGAG